MSVLLLGIVFGLITASVISIAAIGLTLSFGVTNFVNFAYGCFLTIGAYIAFLCNSTFGMNIWVAMIISGILCGIISMAMNRIVIQPFVSRKATLLIMLVVTLGLSLFLDNVIEAVWGTDLRKYDTSQGTALFLGPVSITVEQVMIILIAVILMSAIHVLLKFTTLGKAMRAMSDDSELAKISGIRVKQITDITWLITGALGGIAGVVLALNVNNFTPTLGSNFLFIIFSAVILGGIGSPYGAIAGALVIGLVTEISATYIDSSYKQVVAFAILILVLLFRPQGIFSQRGKA